MVMLGLVGVIALSWAYTVHMAWNMGMGSHMHAAMVTIWHPMNILMLFVMWSVMMIAMMASTVWPVVLSFASTYGQRHEMSSFVRASQ